MTQQLTRTTAETEDLPDGTGCLYVLDGSGDSRFKWTRTNPDEVAAAKETFERLSAKGYWAYRVNDKGEKRERIHAFDPDAERLIMSPQVVGG